jgi:arsenite methyltransferase
MPFDISPLKSAFNSICDKKSVVLAIFIRCQDYEMNKQEITELENPYFDLQVEMGITKHAGGMNATKELVGLCHIDKDKILLVVGSGSGISACKIAKIYGCSIVGIDISKGMVEKSSRRAEKQGLTDRIEFSVADIQDLPFEDNMFDAVISESVTAFSEDKARALNEYVRVVKKSGYIGLNEVTWMDKPTMKMAEYGIRAMGGVKPETVADWERLMEKAGLEDIVARPKKLKIIEQVISELKMNGLTPAFKATYRMLWVYITKPAYRKAINGMVKDARDIPKDFKKYYGYGIYAGIKPL